MRNPFAPPVIRLRVQPDDPRAVVAPRPRGSRRPHTDANVAAVRRLIENSTLTYAQIAAKTGVGRASICRWTSDQGWKRPLFAPRATDTVPSARAGARLKARTLHARLAALAERHIRELEAAACVDPDKLGEALELLKMAKLAARPKKRRRTAAEAAADASLETWETGPRAVMGTMRSAGVRPERAPEDALEDFIASRAPPPEKRRRTRKGRIRSDDYHAWLQRRE
ncbi:MAG TPA: hypothetical protein VEX61_12375 [Burkholderiales bacterium]|nr:hypothetical protein [Burkholderiales bacterium]